MPPCTFLPSALTPPPTVVPLTLLTLAAITLNIIAAFTPVELPSFDPTDLGALVLASGRGDLHHLDANADGAMGDDAHMHETKVRFATSGDSSKPWGIVLRGD